MVHATVGICAGDAPGRGRAGVGRGQARWEGGGRSERQGLVWDLTAAAAKSDIAAGGRGAKVDAAQPLSLTDHRTEFKPLLRERGYAAYAVVSASSARNEALTIRR